MKRTLLASISCLFLFFSCSIEEEGLFTGKEVSIVMISGNVQNNVTNGLLTIKERSDGKAQIEIAIENLISNAIHPVHLHYGALDDGGNVATMLNNVIEENGKGKSVTILGELSNGEQLSYLDLMDWNGSIKVHFEASGPLEKALIASSNIGLNQAQNAAYMQGDKEITLCEGQF